MSNHTQHDLQWSEEITLSIELRTRDLKIAFLQSALDVYAKKHNIKHNIKADTASNFNEFYEGMMCGHWPIEDWSIEMKKAQACIAELSSFLDLIESHFTEQDLPLTPWSPTP